MRSRFLVLYDTVNILVQAGQNNFAVLASATRKCTSTSSPRTILRSRFAVTFTFLVRHPAIARSMKAQSGYTRLYGALPESCNRLFWDTTRTHRGGSCSRTFGQIDGDVRAFASSHPLASLLAHDHRVVCQHLTFNTTSCLVVFANGLVHPRLRVQMVTRISGLNFRLVTTLPSVAVKETRPARRARRKPVTLDVYMRTAMPAYSPARLGNVHVARTRARVHAQAQSKPREVTSSLRSF